MKKGKDSIYCRYIKRILDILCALAAMVVFCWLYAIVAVLVRIKLGSPVIFKQPRPGKDEKIFNLYKFRSMTDERDADGNLLPDEQRVTKFGKWIRGTSLDELPEAWNILKGDMSVVGPRPQLVRDMVFMTEAQRRRHSVRPGLTGLAQVSGRNALQWDKKLAADITYIQRISFGLDCCIIWRTVQQVFFHKRALEYTQVDIVDITDDFGDYLLKKDRISQSEFDRRQQEARKLLGEHNEILENAL
ncbi:MAG: sugar transferase [Eubacteriales bacterium]|nr:sugar transferase [Eubacteriales bacterium]